MSHGTRVGADILEFGRIAVGRDAESALSGGVLVCGSYDIEKIEI
jgi:hypothetical protein